MNVHMCEEAIMMVMEMFSIKGMVRGYHMCNEIWDTALGEVEELSCQCL